MPYDWPEDTDFALWELDVLDRDCPVCGRMMYICDHRYRRFHTLEGPVQLVCKLNHCPDPACPGHAKTKSPELEVTIALPKWAIGWDVFCWIGHRRCSRHWSIPQIQSELRDDYAHQALGRLPSPGTSGVTRSCSPRGSKTPRPCGGNTNRSTRSSSRSTACNPRRDTRPSTSCGN